MLLPRRGSLEFQLAQTGQASALYKPQVSLEAMTLSHFIAAQ
jgi:hypothetical protein